jgi:hypothetical protein
MTPNRLGLVVGAAFGLVYVVVNGRALPTPVSLSLQSLGVIAFIGVLIALRRAEPLAASDGLARQGFGRGYWLVVAAEVVAFAGGNALLNGPLDLPRGVLPWISFVVGVHFLGLAKVWAEAPLAWVGGGIAVLGLIGLGLAVGGASDAVVATVAGVCPGVLLLTGSLWSAAGSPGQGSPGRRPNREAHR